MHWGRGGVGETHKLPAHSTPQAPNLHQDPFRVIRPVGFEEIIVQNSSTALKIPRPTYLPPPPPKPLAAADHFPSP